MTSGEERGVVYLDLDETLVHTREELPVLPALDKVVRAELQGGVAARMSRRRIAMCEEWEEAFRTEHGFTLVRPGAMEFLEVLGREADLYVFSAGRIDYVEAVLRRTSLCEGLQGWFSTREPPEECYPRGGGRWVLVDDMTPGSVGVKTKVTRILGTAVQEGRREELSRRHVVRAPSWCWDPGDGELLGEILDEVRARLKSLSG